MTRRRNNEDNAVEELELEIKKLKSIIRHLEKELKKSNKKYKTPTYIEEEPMIDPKQCPECFRGHLKEVVLGTLRMFMKCSECGYRTKTVRIDK